MANPRFYYYPDPDGSLETIDLGEGLTDLAELPAATVEDAMGADGYPYRSFLGATLDVRIMLERFGTPGTSSLERKLMTLQSHLNKGGFIGFSRDHAKTWAGITASNGERGDLALHMYGAGSGFSGWSSSGSPAAGDEMVAESGNPNALREYFLCDTLMVTPATDIPVPSPGLIYTYGSTAVVRWRDFYPVLWAPSGQVGRPLVTHDHRRNWTLDVTLRYSPRAVIQLWEAESTYGSRGRFDSDISVPSRAGGFSMPFLRDDTSKAGLGGSSLDGLLRPGRTGRFRGRP